jgi:Raf kinase inhibitor-like YbhB/YbcL family protein
VSHGWLMLERLPAVVGRSLLRVRPGLSRIVSRRQGITRAPATIELHSPAFADHQSIPEQFTADGGGASPPLVWWGVPDGARSLALIVEDADSPTPMPLVHAIVGHLPPVLTELTEGALVDREGSPLLGKNSYLRASWLPPDPPPGHGRHRYAFQIFALDHDPALGAHPGRHALVDALIQHTIARGLLIGTYERE